MSTTTFNWGEELHATVVKSLTTSFGLDFLLFQDRTGGDVNTVHNVRQGIFATDAERQRYEQREAYDSHEYHRHANYIKTNREGKAQRLAGKLKDSYTGETFAANGVTNLDHIVAANEIHHDAGRILAELNGADLANDASNLTFTNESLNKSKKAKPMSAFIQDLQTQYQATTQEIATLKNKPELTEQEQKRLKTLENKAGADFDKMREADEKARAKYNATINRAYYTGSKFFSDTAQASVTNGLKMGTRQMLGMVLAEVWFEFRQCIPEIYQNHRQNFQARDFAGDLGDALRAVWTRVRGRFTEFLVAFKDGAIGGILSTVTTTLVNIVFTTQKMVVRLIREMWNNLVQAFKLMVFNPQNLAPGELTKAVSKVIAAGIAVTAGVIINEHLATLFAFPFGPELAAFCGALATGLLTLVMNYFLEHSALMQKLWAFLDRFKDKFQRGLAYFEQVNVELDRYLTELAALEFSMNVDELALFSHHLSLVNSELERELLLRQEVERRNIDLPFEAGNMGSVNAWLKSL